MSRITKLVLLDWNGNPEPPAEGLDNMSSNALSSKDQGNDQADNSDLDFLFASISGDAESEALGPVNANELLIEQEPPNVEGSSFADMIDAMDREDWAVREAEMAAFLALDEAEPEMQPEPGMQAEPQMQAEPGLDAAKYDGIMQATLAKAVQEMNAQREKEKQPRREKKMQTRRKTEMQAQREIGNRRRLEAKPNNLNTQLRHNERASPNAELHGGINLGLSFQNRLDLANQENFNMENCPDMYFADRTTKLESLYFPLSFEPGVNAHPIMKEYQERNVAKGIIIQVQQLRSIPFSQLAIAKGYKSFIVKRFQEQAASLLVQLRDSSFLLEYNDAWAVTIDLETAFIVIRAHEGCAASEQMLRFCKWLLAEKSGCALANGLIWIMNQANRSARRHSPQPDQWQPARYFNNRGGQWGMSWVNCGIIPRFMPPQQDVSPVIAAQFVFQEQFGALMPPQMQTNAPFAAQPLYQNQFEGFMPPQSQNNTPSVVNPAQPNEDDAFMQNGGPVDDSFFQGQF